MPGVLLTHVVSTALVLSQAQTVPPAAELGWTAPAGTARVAAVAPPWGACGYSTDPNKLVRLFVKNRVTDYVLRCGGPKYSRSPTWGYRHILWRHRSQFEQLALGTYQNWRDVADLAMSHNTSDPDVVKSSRGKTCFSRVIYLVNRRTNQTVRKAIVRMIVSNSTHNIITAYPGSHCR